MKDICEEYDDVFKDIVNWYLKDKNINNLSDDEIRIIVNRLIYENGNMWEYIDECIYYEIERLLELKEK